MTYDINDFIFIARQKNGVVKIKHDLRCEGNIYRLLQKFGYRRTKLDNRQIYYKRDENNLTPVYLSNIIDDFAVFLKTTDFKNLPSDVKREDILNWYYVKRTIKQNGLFHHCLNENLSDSEIHHLKLKTNDSYKHKFEIQQLVSKLEEWGFIKTIDAKGSFTKKGDPIYYKKFSEDQYLIYSHYIPNRNFKGSFDFWIANFSKEKHIGNREPLRKKDLVHNFKLEKDFPRIEELMIKKGTRIAPVS